MGGTCGVAREGEGPQGVSFYFVSSLGSLHLVGSVFICNILYMGCISSVLISRKIDSCFPGERMRTTQERRTQRRRNTTPRKHLQHHKYVLITTLTTFIHIILLSTFELSHFSLPSTSPFFLHFTSYHPTVSNLHNGRCWNR